MGTNKTDWFGFTNALERVVRSTSLETLFTWLESTSPATWMREATWAFPGALIVHVWSLAFICGISLALVLGLFGVAPRLLPGLRTRFMPLVWGALSVSLLSGLLLLMTYPDQVLTSPVFYSKLILIAVAVALALDLKRRCAPLAFPASAPLALPLKLRAAGLLLAWFLAIVTGRLLYYTY